MEENQEVPPVVVITPEAIAAMTPEQMLQFTRQFHVQTVTQLTKEGIPTGNEDAMKHINNSLNSIDKQALSLIKIESDDKANQNFAKIATEVVATIIEQRHTGGRRVDTPIQAPANHGKLSSNVPPPTLVPGETEIGVPTDNIEAFYERMRS